MGHPAKLPTQFIQELTEILTSEAVTSYYDSSGKSVQDSQPFTGKWILESLDFDPGANQGRAVATFRSGGTVVRAVIDASDFPDLVHGERDPTVNSTNYSDLAYHLSILLMEQILMRDPSDMNADHVRIHFPA